MATKIEYKEKIILSWGMSDKTLAELCLINNKCLIYRIKCNEKHFDIIFPQKEIKDILDGPY